MRALLTILMTCLLAACASAPSTPRLTLPELRLAPVTMGSSLSLTQRLLVTHVPSAASASAATQRSLDTLLEIDADSVRIAGFALGQRVMSLAWDGKQLDSTQHAMLPAQVDAAHVLRDVQLLYWPAQAVRAVLPAGWTLQDDSGEERSLYHEGTAEVVMHYQGAPRWIGRIELDNRLEGYRMVIESKLQEEQ